MSLRIFLAFVCGVLVASVRPAMAQAPTCTTSGTTMTCTFPAGGSGSDPHWVTSGSNISNINSGFVGIGLTTPGVKLDVQNSDAGGYGQLLLRTSTGHGWGLGTQDGTDRFYLRSAVSGVTAMTLDPSGNVSVGVVNATRRLSVLSPSYGAPATSGTDQPNGIVRFTAGTTDGIDIGVFATGTTWLQANNSAHLEVNNHFVLQPNGGNVGIGTGSPTYKLHVVGNAYVDGNISARYQDVAEWVRTKHPLDAGTVVVVGSSAGDANLVETSHRSYDTSVAGVVSSQPGLALGEAGEDKVLVAQSGRVRVKVDASYGAIRAGDLLATSPKAGVAMRSKPMSVGGATFHRPGTLLGKALESLERGQGEILVLLTLQ